MERSHKGGCVCGSVRYQTEGNPLRVSLCTCSWCQRRTGSALGVSVYFAAEKVTLLQGSLKKYRLKSDAGRWLEQEFCTTCGCTLTWTLEYWPDYRGIAGGTFDPPTFWFEPERLVYARSKPDWLGLPPNIEICQAMPERPGKETSG